jgi:hypothetical protein
VGRDIHLIFVLNLKSNQNGISSSRKLAKSLMLKHGLEEWSFAWDNPKFTVSPLFYQGYW